jgi:hypothetical protein
MSLQSFKIIRIKLERVAHPPTLVMVTIPVLLKAWSCDLINVVLFSYVESKLRAMKVNRQAHWFSQGLRKKEMQTTSSYNISFSRWNCCLEILYLRTCVYIIIFVLL